VPGHYGNSFARAMEFTRQGYANLTTTYLNPFGVDALRLFGQEEDRGTFTIADHADGYLDLIVGRAVDRDRDTEKAQYLAASVEIERMNEAGVHGCSSGGCNRGDFYAQIRVGKARLDAVAAGRCAGSTQAS
jgi:hypothetical protein